MSILERFSLRGKVAVVTGGSRGIGKAIALGFAEAGAAVAIAARDETKSQEALAQLLATGAKAIAIKADVSQRGDLEAMLAAVTDQLGPVDVLVNNAGIGFHADALTLEDSEWTRLFDANLHSVWMASQIVGGQMASRRTGSIINIGSISGFIVKSTAMALSVRRLKSGGASPDEVARRRMGDQGSARQRNRARLCEDRNRQHGIRGLSSLLRDEVPMQRYATARRNRAHRLVARQRRRLLHHRFCLRGRWGVYALVAARHTDRRKAQHWKANS